VLANVERGAEKMVGEKAEREREGSFEGRFLLGSCIYVVGVKLCIVKQRVTLPKKGFRK